MASGGSGDNDNKNFWQNHWTPSIKTLLTEFFFSGIFYKIDTSLDFGGFNEKEQRDFWVFRNRFKNVIFGFFGVEKFIKILISSSRNIRNFEKIDIIRKFQFCLWIFSKFWMFLELEMKILINFPTQKNPNITFSNTRKTRCSFSFNPPFKIQQKIRIFLYFLTNRSRFNNFKSECWFSLKSWKEFYTINEFNLI